MKFFVPATDNEKEAETLYKEIRQFARKNTSPLTDRRIQIISFRDKGRLVSAEVGKIDPIVGETVVAILETIEPGPYLVCTPNRGVLNGVSVPILVGRREVSSITDFDA